MNSWRNVSLAVTAAAVLAMTTACGQDGADGAPGSRTVGNPAPAQRPAQDGYGEDQAPAAEPRPAGQLAARDTGQLGKVVTDSAGMTLYRFDKDTAKPPTSNCGGDCAKTWPPVPAASVTAPPGTAPDLVGEVTRGDGRKQLTLGGWPMYRYAGDAAAGDAKGQGVGGTWFASAPDGKKAAASPEKPDAGTEKPDAAAPGAEGPEGAASPGAPADRPGMSVRKDPELGEIVVDRRGRTVYRFKKDSAWPMKSACTGDCLAKWPAVAPVPKNDTEGILKKGYVVFDRPDGAKQQTIDCWPLYTYSGDTGPGDTNGQGVGGTWYAVSPQGRMVGAPR
ncbi:SCO0930 family lipoprotein [Streptomyces candidus]|uniref:Putative lipoprotein with Yx(FWY)xxD motif n=1 Tax=Streptomyces candidus TaxID=67283 RepID=A0A7X0LS12_9ACTN|nr:SCO0930 family lipoprotein [Streptomyces candidus]MBB6438735.1 putative lipoprotein with Yx(FWY)xxD motif [Streptomyces candidus]GHH53180.1 lipoprotein [Streptomyces candidus]